LRVCLRLPAYSASAKVICFIGKLGGWGRGILPNQKVFFRVSLDEVVAQSDVLIIGNGEQRFAEVMNSVGDDKQIVDLVGFMAHATQANKEGICW